MILSWVRPAELSLDEMDLEAARCTCSVIMFLGPLLHSYTKFKLLHAGGCDIEAQHHRAVPAGARPIWAPLYTRLTAFTTAPLTSRRSRSGRSPSPNAATPSPRMLCFAAALSPAVTVLRNASPNYMVQDLCIFLTIRSWRSTALVPRPARPWRGEHQHRRRIRPCRSDLIEAMSLLTAGIVTQSDLTIKRAPIEFLEIELAILEEMGLDFSLGEEYPAVNGHTRLVDLTAAGRRSCAPIDKIHPMPFPGLNIDNPPFFAVIAATAKGKTIIHDRVYENRAIYSTELNRLGARACNCSTSSGYRRRSDSAAGAGSKWCVPRRCGPRCASFFGMLAAR